MPHSPEFIGKAHEKLTRDILNREDPQEDTKEMLNELSEDEMARVEIGAEKTAQFIEEKVDFQISKAEEVGDKFKPDPEEDVDIVVRGDNSERAFSLKMTSSSTMNVRNTLASKISENILEEEISDLLTVKEMKRYEKLTQDFARGKISGSDMGSEMTEIFCKYFNEKKGENEEELRRNLLKEIRIDSDMVACKVTPKGKFKGFVSPEREAFKKFKNMKGSLEIFTKESNNTSIFFELGGESLFRIDMYGQSNGSTRKPRVKCVYRVAFGKESSGKQATL